MVGVNYLTVFSMGVHGAYLRDLLVDSCIRETSCHREKRLISSKYAFILGCISFLGRSLALHTLRSHAQELLQKCLQGAYLRDCATDVIIAYIWNHDSIAVV